jgi:hypothetical protein
LHNQSTRSIHESAHAVVCHMLCGECEFLTIQPGKDGEAHVGGIDDSYDKATVDASGAVAELIEFPRQAVDWRTGHLSWKHDIKSLISNCQGIRDGQLNYDWKCPCGSYGGCLVHDNPAKNSFDDSVDHDNPIKIGYSDNKHATMCFWILTDTVPSPLDITDQDFEDFELLSMIFEDSKRILTEQWDIVVRLAAILEHQKTLNSEQIRYIVEY